MISTVLTWTKFEMIWVLTAGGLGTQPAFFHLHLYKAFRNFDIGSGSAVAVISMVAMLIFVIAYFTVLKLVEDDNNLPEVTLVTAWFLARDNAHFGARQCGSASGRKRRCSEG